MAATNQERRPQHWQQEQDAISQQRLEQRQAAYAEVHALHAQGTPVAEITRQVGISRKTVSAYLRQDQPPTRRVPQRRRTDRVLAPYEGYLRQRWQAGCHNSHQLWREICDQGYQGSRRTVTRFIGDLRQNTQEGGAIGREGSPFTRRRGPAARDVLRALLRPADQRSTMECQYLEQLRATAPDLATTETVVQEFLDMVRNRAGERLDTWLERVDQQGCAVLQRFANGLRDDLDAVRAGLTERWSNGVTEGHVHRLKLVKRQCYGRAGFVTLRARVLHA